MVARTNHLYRLVVVHLIEHAELLVGLCFEVEGESGGEEYSHEDAYWLKENLCALMQSYVLVYGNGNREYAGDKKNDDKRVAEFLKKLFPERRSGRRREHVNAVLGTTVSYLMI